MCRIYLKKIVKVNMNIIINTCYVNRTDPGPSLGPKIPRTQKEDEQEKEVDVCIKKIMLSI